MTEKKIRVGCYRSDRSACWFFRVHVPMANLTKNHSDYKVSVYDYITEEQYPNLDIAILQRQYNPNIAEEIKKIKKLGKKVVYEIDDDLFSTDPTSPAHKVFGRKDLQDSIKRLVSACDAVFVSTEALTKVYGEYCKNVYVLPNSIAFEIFHPSPNNSAKKVVCWQGSSTHQKDLRIIEKHVKRLVDDGYFVKTVGENVPGAYEVPPVEFKSFYQLFSQLDASVGLAPLIPMPFNRSKSNLKFLEYSAQKIATVASNFGPYAESIEDGETGLLVSDNRDWYDKVKYLLDNDDERNRIIENAYQYVKENFDINKNYLLWKNAIDDVIGSLSIERRV